MIDFHDFECDGLSFAIIAVERLTIGPSGSMAWNISGKAIPRSG